MIGDGRTQVTTYSHPNSMQQVKLNPFQELSQNFEYQGLCHSKPCRDQMNWWEKKEHLIETFSCTVKNDGDTKSGITSVLQAQSVVLSPMIKMS